MDDLVRAVIAHQTDRVLVAQEPQLRQGPGSGKDARPRRAAGQRRSPGPAAAIMAALQGGLLLAQTTRTTAPLEHSLDMALEHVEHRTTSTEAPGSDQRT
ncbi:MAG: hypothetical protein H0U77_12755 [Nocardioidaceae bacterium]|nr:hypothetical protein [Nocardioidaceae bacterium]